MPRFLPGQPRFLVRFGGPGRSGAMQVRACVEVTALVAAEILALHASGSEGPLGYPDPSGGHDEIVPYPLAVGSCHHTYSTPPTWDSGVPTYHDWHVARS